MSGISRDSVVGQILIEAAKQQGWSIANVGEAQVAREFESLGYSPADFMTQFKVGPYRLDFALPAAQIDVEADGWVHTAKQVRTRDNRRDWQLRKWGWTVVRIDIERDDIGAQLRRLLPPCVRIDGYCDTLRNVGAIFSAYLDRLQRHGDADPEQHAERLRDALLASYRAALTLEPQQS